MYQAFVDESGGKGHTSHFVMASLLSTSEAWALFSDEWRRCLAETPAIRYFKMKEAANCSGQFRGWKPEDRNTKLGALAKIINRFVISATYCILDLNAHEQAWAHLQIPAHKDPYFYPYHTTIMATCYEVWEQLLCREKFEIIFDENVILGPRARMWYPVIQEIVRVQDPDSFSIMPESPIFKTDNEFPPLQAADLYAWCWRTATTLQGPIAFEWLLEETKDVKLNPHSQIYDLDRMKKIAKMSLETRPGDIPSSVTDKFRKISVKD
jgi:hypothetical protein